LEFNLILSDFMEVECVVVRQKQKQTKQHFGTAWLLNKDLIGMFFELQLGQN